ncbi:hypothetical protein SAMN05216436_12921 [bacterium A37T11]|nr:hypothetical protein SAMN05216436_12921 [bacterium A37T11]
MKKQFLFAFLILGLNLGLHQMAAAQQTPYKTAFGLFLDLGNGGTYVGPHIKHFLNNQNAIQGTLLFGNGATFIGGDYSYNKQIQNAPGLFWNVSGGAQIGFGNDQTAFLLRPAVGLEYKIKEIPIAVGFDWRPSWQLTQGSHFEAGRFGLTFKYVFK